VPQLPVKHADKGLFKPLNRGRRRIRKKSYAKVFWATITLGNFHFWLAAWKHLYFLGHYAFRDQHHPIHGEAILANLDRRIPRNIASDEHSQNSRTVKYHRIHRFG
jgi:hypothetical protein